MAKLSNTFFITEEELTQRATDVIELSKNNDSDSVISIFENICLPFSNQNFKKQLFEQIFTLAEINYLWDEELGFIIHSENRTQKTVVSHMDLIFKFNLGFSKGETHIIKDNKLSGALDNTFTNAVVINHILNNKHDDTSYLFTLDEETTQKAIKGYMERFGTEQFIINLDITNEGMKNNMAIEYDEPSWEICKQINENLNQPFFTTDRVCDDLDEVIKAKGKGFSYCLPTKGNIHSYNNWTYLNKIQPYMDGLDFLVAELCLDNKNCNIEHLAIKKAISYSSFKKFKKKDIRKVKTYGRTHHHTQNNNIKNSNNIDYTYYEERFSPELNSYISEYNLGKDFSSFIISKLKYSDPFSMDEFFQKFHSADFGQFLELGFVINISRYQYKLNPKKIFSMSIDKEKFNSFVLNFVSYLDKTHILEVNNFLTAHSKEGLFTVSTFTEYSEEWILIILKGYDIFKQIDDYTYRFNYQFMDTNLFKIWEITFKEKSFDSFALMRNFTDKKYLSYVDFLSYEENNSSVADNLIRKLSSERLITSKKKGFKIS